MNKSIEQILKEDYSEEFDNLRKNRVTLSRYKYGSVKTNYENNLINALGSLEKCIDKYKKTKNTEYLLDAGNYIMFEFMFPSVSGANFKATDSKDSAGIDGISHLEMDEMSKN